MSDDETIEDLLAAFEAGEQGVTAPPWQWIADILGTSTDPAEVAERIRELQTTERLASGRANQAVRMSQLYSAVVMAEFRTALQDAGHGEAALMAQDESDRLRVKASERS